MKHKRQNQPMPRISGETSVRSSRYVSGALRALLYIVALQFSRFRLPHSVASNVRITATWRPCKLRTRVQGGSWLTADSYLTA